MQNLSNMLFIDRYPKIDLHGYTAALASLATKDFIQDNLKLKNEIIVIVHGKGTGVLKNAVHNTLKQHRKVLEYTTYYNNSGCTVVRLNV